jgi:hypothetical protein
MKLICGFLPSTAVIMNECTMNNGGCSHQCHFNYQESLKTTCSCPPGHQLAADKVTCTPDVGKCLKINVTKIL